MLAVALAAPAARQAATVPVARELTSALIYGGTLDGLPPSRFQWSPAGDRFTFTRRPDQDAAPQLFVYDVASRRVTALTANEEGPRKLSVSSSRWSPTGDAVVIVSDGDLYLLGAPREGTPPEPRRLTTTDAEESDPKLSPDGRMVGFVRDHDLRVIDLATGAERALTRGGSEEVANGEVDWVYGEEFELDSAWWWSPGGPSRIAYLQFDERAVPTYPIVDWIPTHPETKAQRYPKAGDPNPLVRLGVVTAAGGETRWIDLGAENEMYVPRVAWADASLLAVQRLNRAQTHLDLLDCDTDTGACRKVLEEDDPKWLNIGNDAAFLGKRFLWGSERDGHRHLYLYERGGRLVRQLTRGAWDVTDLMTPLDAGPVLFTATERSPLERHLYRVGLDGTGFSRVTQEEGWHAVEVNGQGTAFIDTHSTANEAPRITLRRIDGTAIDTLDEGVSKELAGYRRGRAEFRTVPAPDGTPLPASITLPPGFDPRRKHPVLIYVYGGPHAQVVMNQWGGTRGLWHQMMAARGFIVWSLDNRGMGARGHAWETPIHRDMGRQELADQLAGVAYLRTLPYVDASRIGIWGWSYGGYMTLYALLNAPDVFRAGVAVAPVTDWRDYDTIYTERYMGLPSDNEKGYLDSAPLRKAGELKAPLLLVHGSSDDNVHLQNSVQILDAFVKAGRPVDFMLYPKKGHGILGPETRTHLFEKITRFLTENLMGKP